MSRARSPEIDWSDTKQVPQERSVREQIRQLAAASVADLSKTRPPQRSDLESRADRILDRLALPRRHLGFAMVAVSNGFWAPQFEAVPCRRRVLLLPHCLTGDRSQCKGRFEADGVLQCVACRECEVRRLKEAAEELGYRVLIFDGTPPVLNELAARTADAILGVACLDSLERAFDKTSDLGVPNMAVPLLNNGCAYTRVESDLVLTYLRAHAPSPPTRVRSYAPLLRATAELFDPEPLQGHLERVLGGESETDRIAIDWIGAGGKRFRPFVTLAAYATARHGPDVLASDADLPRLIPDAVKALAIAIEVLHKASLVHDDIEDADAFRYGVKTLHQRHGVASAINIGDYLVGLGYRLIAAQADRLGPETTGDILSHLSAAHLDLCRGQGDELLWTPESGPPKPVDALAIYAHKTAPAFEIALYAGLRAAEAVFEPRDLRAFAVYVGEAYQLLNDLDDWQGDRHNKVRSGSGATARRPTLLRAFAAEAGAAGELTAAGDDPERIRRIYETYGVFDKAERLVDKLRRRATQRAESQQRPALRELLLFIVRIVL